MTLPTISALPRLYLAGPLFTSAEQWWNRELAHALRAYGYRVFLPQEQKPEPNTALNIFESDVTGLERSDVIVANLDGPDPDSGTSWEVAYGYNTHRPVIAYRTDFREISDKFAPFNLMLWGSVIYIPCILETVNGAAIKIHGAIESLVYPTR